LRSLLWFLADPEAGSKAEWSRAKRLILAVLRVQPGPDILSSLVAEVTDEDLDKWDQIAQDAAHGLPPLPGQQTYNLNDIKKWVLRIAGSRRCLGR
jgi:hypothetical protein